VNCKNYNIKKVYVSKLFVCGFGQVLLIYNVSCTRRSDLRCRPSCAHWV